MVPEQTDKIFEEKFEEFSSIPKNIKWNKEDAWKRFQKQTKKNNILKILKYFSAAAVFVLFIFMSLPKINDLKNRSSLNAFREENVEYQKRQKLKEIEMKISGKKVYKNYCMNCEGRLPNRKEIPVKELIFIN